MRHRPASPLRFGIVVAVTGLLAAAGAHTLNDQLGSPDRRAQRVAVTPGPRIAGPSVDRRPSGLPAPPASGPPATTRRVPSKAKVTPPDTQAPQVTRTPPTTVGYPSAASDPCAASIAAVEARGLYPAPGFVVVCPGNAHGHEGMTCMNEPGICPAASEIVISVAEPFVVANEFENSRIFAGVPARCDTIDCGGGAYGY